MSYLRIVAILGLCCFAQPGLFAGDAEDDAQHAWEADLHAPVRWEVLPVVDAVSKLGRLEHLPDGSLRAAVNVAGREEYTITTTTELRSITAFRVELIRDGGANRLGGDAVLSEFGVSSADAGKAAVFVLATSDCMQAGSNPENAIDGDLKTDWECKGSAAVFQLGRPMAEAAGKRLVFKLSQMKEGRNLLRFRISATTQRPPVLELPALIRQTIALEPSERSSEQRKTLTDFFSAFQKQNKSGAIAQ